MTVVGKQKCARRNQARFEREDVRVAALADIVEIVDTPFLHRLADRRTARDHLRRGVNHRVVGDKRNALRIEQPVNTPLVEHFLAVLDVTVVNNDEIGVRINRLSGAHGGEAAGARQNFFGGGHSHADSLNATRNRRS